MTRTTKHFVFGYGSLICKHSRALTTAPPHKVATPILVHGLRRIWAVRAPTFTAMGVKFTQEEGAETVGVLIPVEESDFVSLDERELGYDRLPLDLRNVQTVPFLNPKDHYSEPDHEVFLKAQPGDICIWVYVPQLFSPPAPQAPIVQSYLDTILRGCLDYSEEFAISFLRTTAGWHPDKEDLNANEVHFVNDRDAPIYPRGDPEWSKEHGSRLDRLLESCRPHFFRHRKLV